MDSDGGSRPHRLRSTDKTWVPVPDHVTFDPSRTEAVDCRKKFSKDHSKPADKPPAIGVEPAELGYDPKVRWPTNPSNDSERRDWIAERQTADGRLRNHFLTVKLLINGASSVA